jgi:hypothetical protein
LGDAHRENAFGLSKEENIISRRHGGNYFKLCFCNLWMGQFSTLRHINIFYILSTYQQRRKDLGFDSRQRQTIFRFSLPFGSAVEPIQSPMQWVSGAHSPGKSGRSVKLTTHIHLQLRLIVSRAILPCPIRLYSVILNQLLLMNFMHYSLYFMIIEELFQGNSGSGLANRN